jgi:hypothetical protein
MNQCEVRIRFRNYLENSGVKQTYVAKNTCLPTDLLSRFKNEKRDLFLLDLQKLDEFLLSKGF